LGRWRTDTSIKAISRPTWATYWQLSHPTQQWVVQPYLGPIQDNLYIKIHLLHCIKRGMIEKGTTKERIEERKRSNSITSARRPIQEMERSSIASCGMLEKEAERELPGGRRWHGSERRRREVSLVAGSRMLERGGGGKTPWWPVATWLRKVEGGREELVAARARSTWKERGAERGTKPVKKP
jgi:hypothetical protein